MAEPLRADVFTTMALPTSLPTHVGIAATAVRIRFNRDVAPYATFEVASFLPTHAAALGAAGLAAYA